jgi:hypothetical protein
MGRKEKLLERLASRTDHEGKPRPGYAESVANIRAELAMYEERSALAKKEAQVGSDSTNAG